MCVGLVMSTLQVKQFGDFIHYYFPLENLFYTMVWTFSRLIVVSYDAPYK